MTYLHHAPSTGGPALHSWIGPPGVSLFDLGVPGRSVGPLTGGDDVVTPPVRDAGGIARFATTACAADYPPVTAVT